MSFAFPNPYAGIAANIDIKARADINSWKDCAIFMEGAAKKTLGSNVSVVHHWAGDTFGVVLYDTEIVTYFKDGTFSVSNGGFATVTTSRRVNQFSPKGYWFYHNDRHLTLHGRKVSIEDVRLPNERERE